MIVADTSVWIDYLNGRMTPQTDLLDDALVDGMLAMGDLIFLEILRGIKDDHEFKAVQTKLSLLDQYAMFDQSMIFKCANNYRSLRRKGVTVRKTNDVIIASFCIDKEFALLYSDRDFSPFTEHLGLKSAELEN
ncbi:MAG: type II toxin-antitoxin system VapC family toxin [Thiotrichales bacterium]